MKMKIILSILSAVILLIFSGCDNSTTKTYFSKNGDYSIKYPGECAWEDDPSKFVEYIEKQKGENSSVSVLNMDIPDVLFKGPDNLGGMIVVKTVGNIDEKTFLDSVSKQSLLYFDSKNDIGVKDFNGNKFYIFEYGINNLRKGLMAIGLHNGKLFTIGFDCNWNEFPKNNQILTECINSLSFDNLIISEQKEESKSGFWTGLWQGFLFPIRFILSFFMNFELFAALNTGFWYWCGMVVGALPYILGFFDR
jgi:hypothetical protein